MGETSFFTIPFIEDAVGKNTKTPHFGPYLLLSSCENLRLTKISGFFEATKAGYERFY